MRPRVTLIGFWLAGTAFAMLLAALAVQMAGARVTDPHRATISRPQVETELAMSVAQDATSTTTRGPDTETAAGVPGAEGSPGAPRPTTTAGPEGAPGPADDGRSGPGGPSTTTAGPTGSPTIPAAPPVTVDDHGGGGGGGSTSNDPTTTRPPGNGSPGGPSTTQPPVPGPPQTFPLVGGSVTVQCIGTLIQVVDQAPADGYTSDYRGGGPVTNVSVKFSSTITKHQSELKARCADGAIVPEIIER